MGFFWQFIVLPLTKRFKVSLRISFCLNLNTKQSKTKENDQSLTTSIIIAEDKKAQTRPVR